MIVSNIFSRIFHYAYTLIALTVSNCNHKTATSQPVSAVQVKFEVPKRNPGNTARFVTVEMDITAGSKPGFFFTDLPYDKNKGMMLMKDDASRSDYTVVLKMLNGGTAYGVKSPGFTFTDGTGKRLDYRYSFAINPNEGHTTDLEHVTSWKQINEIIDKGHGYMNHSMFHGGDDKLKAIKDAEKNMWAHTHYRMTEIVVPQNDEGYAESGLQLGYNLISSEFGEPVPDGNNSPGNENMSWGSYIPVLTQNFNKVLISRTNLGDKWDKVELKNAENFIDYVFTNPDINKKLIGAAFNHGPGETTDAARNFLTFLTYIRDHAANHDSAWITSSRDLMDYMKTKKQVTVSSKEYDRKTGKYKIVFDMANVNPNVVTRNLSIKITGGKISNVHGQGFNDLTYNPATGLINIYKTDRSKVVNPYRDPLPPQIVDIRAKSKTIQLTYDKPVKQSKTSGYEIPGNPVKSLTGNGKVWRLTLENQIKKTDTFYYRIWKGDAHDATQPSLRVCTYAGSPIKF
jgi:hypothetical protein